MVFYQYISLVICVNQIIGNDLSYLVLGNDAQHSTVSDQGNLSPITDEFENATFEFENATFFEHRNYKGKSLTIYNDDPERCFNFYRSNYSTTSFYKYISSLHLNGSCLVFYDDLGCTGHEFEVSPQNNSHCQESLVPCGWNDRISSLRFCSTTLPTPYRNPKGPDGDLCVDACKSRGKLYFWCHLKNGSRDICSPKPGIDHFGNECEQHCSTLDAASDRYVLKQVFLVQRHSFTGTRFEISTKNQDQCTNLRYYNTSDANYDNRASSVDLGQSCVILHEHIGCTGRSVKLNWNDTNSCAHQLSNCSFDDMTTSVSFCGAKFPANYDKSKTIGYNGSRCINSCEARGKPYFWCSTQNGNWDYCSPRPALDFLGNNCNGSCVYKDTTFPQSVVLYEKELQHGTEHKLDEKLKPSCLDFGFKNVSQKTPKVTISSIYLDSSCVRLYDNVACTGKYFEITSETEESCWNKIKTCTNYNQIISAQLCTSVYTDQLKVPLLGKSSKSGSQIGQNIMNIPQLMILILTLECFRNA